MYDRHLLWHTSQTKKTHLQPKRDLQPLFGINDQKKRTCQSLETGTWRGLFECLSINAYQCLGTYQRSKQPLQCCKNMISPVSTWCLTLHLPKNVTVYNYNRTRVNQWYINVSIYLYLIKPFSSPTHLSPKTLHILLSQTTSLNLISIYLHFIQVSGEKNNTHTSYSQHTDPFGLKES